MTKEFVQNNMSNLLEDIRRNGISINLGIVDTMWVCDVMNDEKIRKRLIDLIYKVYVNTKAAWLEKQGESYTKKDIDDAYLKGICDAKHELEKQGEQKPFDYENANIQQKDFASVGETATIELSSPIDCGDRIYHVSHKPIEKNGEQKPILDFKASNFYVSKVDGKIHDMTYNPTNKAEQKFKVGDWVVDNHGIVNQVTSTTDDGYGLALYDGTYVSGCWKDYYHLWTIQDAKDGDVLVDEDNNIGIYKEIEGLCWHSYIYLGCDNHLRGFSIGGSHIKNNTKPATKEQRDLLFQTMKEKGYEWDADKKELKKINSYCQENCKGYQETGKCFADGGCDAKRKAEQKSEPAWSEEDEFRFNCTVGYLNRMNDANGGIFLEDIDWLKSLKERIGG